MPWLWLPSQWTHALTPFAIRVLSQYYPSTPLTWKAFQWRNLHFSNPLGTAGGIDKNAVNTTHWQNLGAGFCEVGTITPLPQTANPGKTLDRSLKYQSLWNYLGFPNKGLAFAKKQLANQQKKTKIPLFINLGKNRETPLSSAHKDYTEGIKTLHPFASAFVINISSPNTKDLRALFEDRFLLPFLKNLKDTSDQISPGKPLILKLSPDLEDSEFARVIDCSLKAGIDGWCLCNTTVRRPVQNLFPEKGGMSGKLLAKRSLSLLKKLKQHLDSSSDKLIISCGGALTPEDVLERLNEGANLVQVYSALVFNGPLFFRSVYSGIQKESTTKFNNNS